MKSRPVYQRASAPPIVCREMLPGVPSSQASRREKPPGVPRAATQQVRVWYRGRNITTPSRRKRYSRRHFSAWHRPSGYRGGISRHGIGRPGTEAPFSRHGIGRPGTAGGISRHASGGASARWYRGGLFRTRGPRRRYSGRRFSTRGRPARGRRLFQKTSTRNGDKTSPPASPCYHARKGERSVRADGEP